jgi:competence protein ComEA
MKTIQLLMLLGLFSAASYATPVNINTADAKTISESLAGVGIKKAEAIVADRAKNGAFKSVEDLKRVAGIGDKTIAINHEDILLVDEKVITAPAPHEPHSKTAAPTPEQNTNPPKAAH